MLSFITLVYFLEFGFSPLDQYALGPERVDIENSFYTEMDADVIVADVFFIGGNIQVNYTKSVNGGYTFAPFLSDYTFRAGVLLGPVTVGFEHICIHRVESSNRELPYNGGSRNRFFVRVESNH